MEKRTRRVQVLVTEAEGDVLSVMADRERRTISDTLRLVLLAGFKVMGVVAQGTAAEEREAELKFQARGGIVAAMHTLEDQGLRPTPALVDQEMDRQCRVMEIRSGVRREENEAATDYQRRVKAFELDKVHREEIKMRPIPHSRKTKAELDFDAPEMTADDLAREQAADEQVFRAGQAADVRAETPAEYRARLLSVKVAGKSSNENQLIAEKAVDEWLDAHKADGTARLLEPTRKDVEGVLERVDTLRGKAARKRTARKSVDRKRH
jgi:hypothetical protein